MGMDEIGLLLKQLFGQAQARPDLQQEQPVATYAGRVASPGEDLRSILTRLPTESPDAEGMGGAALAAGGMLALPKPKPYMNVGKKGYFESQYPFDLEVRVTTGANGEAIIDNIKGLNRGHAAARARSNWAGSPIEYLEGTKVK
jgi:hypothetical protein